MVRKSVQRYKRNSILQYYMDLQEKKRLGIRFVDYINKQINNKVITLILWITQATSHA